MGDKLQKLLAQAGLGSRRQLEEIIKAGRISINGTIASLGDRATPQDEVRVDGRLVRLKAEREKRRRVIAYYKPEGEISSASDPEGRPTVFDRLPKLTGDRWVMVGRLDINSSGLLLFTNDGELAHRLMHPSSEITREYAVRVLGEVSPQIAKNLTQGVELEDGMAKFDDIKEGGGTGVNKWYHVSIKEGRKREVRRMFESQELKVSRLIRTRYGTVILPKELRTGRFLELDAKEIGKLIETVGLRPRQGTGLNTTTKEKQARIHKKPLKSREVRRQKHERHEREEKLKNRMGQKRTSNFKNARFTKV
ncbi:23S rRNA pseudouridine(2605) synthase RluB [Moraxella nasovis]|uniref:23S rRNA pseudouridine(2605) synthase RluB n=1 Tax=Moraxella nasovis TaxID=2904121 RepID=UPI0035CD3238